MNGCPINEIDIVKITPKIKNKIVKKLEYQSDTKLVKTFQYLNLDN